MPCLHNFFRIRNLGWFCGWEPITTFRQRSVIFVRDKRLSWTPNPGDLSFSFRTRSLQGVMTGSIDCFLQGSIVGGTEKSPPERGFFFVSSSPLSTELITELNTLVGWMLSCGVSRKQKILWDQRPDGQHNGTILLLRHLPLLIIWVSEFCTSLDVYLWRH